MRSINELIKQIQQGEYTAFIILYEKFRPLIISWLIKTKELYQANKEDYESMAKIILYESAKKFDEARGVPFQSYYKMRLYQWYGNYKKKKEYQAQHLSCDETPFDLSEQICTEERKMQMAMAIQQISSKERQIIIRYLTGFTDEQVAEEMKLCKKTIQNIRYQAIRKMKDFISSNFAQN